MLAESCIYRELNSFKKVLKDLREVSQQKVMIKTSRRIFIFVSFHGTWSIQKCIIFTFLFSSLLFQVFLKIFCAINHCVDFRSSRYLGIIENYVSLLYHLCITYVGGGGNEKWIYIKRVNHILQVKSFTFKILAREPVEKNSSTIGLPTGLEPTPWRCQCTHCFTHEYRVTEG